MAIQASKDGKNTRKTASRAKKDARSRNVSIAAILATCSSLAKGTSHPYEAWQEQGPPPHRRSFPLHGATGCTFVDRWQRQTALGNAIAGLSLDMNHVTAPPQPPASRYEEPLFRQREAGVKF